MDLVVNDLAPDIVHQLQSEEPRCTIVTSPGTDYAYVGINLRDPALADGASGRPIGFAIDREAIVELPAPRPRDPGGRGPAARRRGPSNAGRVRISRMIPARGAALLDEAGYPTGDGDGTAAPPVA